MRKTIKNQVRCENGDSVIGPHWKNWKESPPEHIKPDDRDRMPYEVATAILLQPKARITNRERKNFQAARANYYVSDREPKSLEVKVSLRLQACTISQLGKWLRRTAAKRREAQSRFQTLKKQSDKIQDKLADKELGKNDRVGWESMLALAIRQMHALDLQVNALDAYKEALDNESNRRTSLCVTKTN